MRIRRRKRSEPKNPSRIIWFLILGVPLLWHQLHPSSDQDYNKLLKPSDGKIYSDVQADGIGVEITLAGDLQQDDDVDSNAQTLDDKGGLKEPVFDPYVAAVSEQRKKICVLEGSSTPPSEIIIDFEKIRAMDKGPLERLKNFTSVRQVQFFLNVAGEEHYPFLSYLSATYGDCRHFTDIGTKFIQSALAMASNQKSPVWTFDMDPSLDYPTRKEAWETKISAAGIEVNYFIVDLIMASAEMLKTIFGTWFVMVNPARQTADSSFVEREIFELIVSSGYKGIVCINHIRLDGEMVKWWKEIEVGAEQGGYKTYDITSIGHAAGTGIVDFSGRVTIKD